MVDSSEKKVLSFEESIERLEQIVAQLDSGQNNLQTSLSQYEEGVRLLRTCHNILEGARRQIAILRKIDEDGQPVLENASENAFQSNESTPGRQNKSLESSKKTKRASSKPTKSVSSPNIESTGSKANPVQSNAEHVRQQDFFSLIDDIENKSADPLDN